MRSTFFVVILFLLLAAGVYFLEDDGDVLAAPVEASQQQSLSSPTVLLTTATFISPTETPDWALGTAMAHFAAETERVRQVELEISQNNAAYATAIDGEIKQDAAELAATQTAEPTARPMTMTAQAGGATQAAANQTAVAFQPTAIVAKAKADAEAKYAEWRELADIGVSIVLIVLCIVFVFVAIGVIRRKPAAVVVRNGGVMHVEKPRGGTERVPDPPGDPDAFRDWAAAAIAGESLAVNPWEEAKRYAGNYRALYGWAGRWGLLMRDQATGETVLSEKGVRIVSEWMIANPLPYGEETL